VFPAKTIAKMAAFMTLKHPDSVLSILVLDEPDCVVTGCLDGAVRVWDGAAWTALQTLRTHSRAVLALHAAQSVLVSGGSDGAIGLYDISPGLPRTVSGHKHSSHAGGMAGRPAAATGHARTVGGFQPVATVKLGGGSVHSALVAYRRPPDTPASAATAGGIHCSVFAGCQDTRVYRVDVFIPPPPVDASATRLPPTIVSHAVFGGSCGFMYALLLRHAAAAASGADGATSPGRAGSAPTSASASGECLLFGGGGDGVIRVWHASCGAPTALLPTAQHVQAGSPSDRFVAAERAMLISSGSGEGNDDEEGGVRVGHKRPRPASGATSPPGADPVTLTLPLDTMDVPLSRPVRGLVVPGATSAPGFVGGYSAVDTLEGPVGDTPTDASDRHARGSAGPLRLSSAAAGSTASADAGGVGGGVSLPGICGSVFALASHGGDIYAGEFVTS